jgi:protein-disulfide isomerase
MNMTEALQVMISARDHIRGRLGAPLTLLEYGDFACPFCAAAHPTVRRLLDGYAGALCFVFRHNPRGELHPGAHLAARAAEAAALQGQFWPMHDLLFQLQAPWSERSLATLAIELELDVARFKEDLNSNQVAQRVREDQIGGLRSGVVGTPTFFINGEHFRDKPDFDTLRAELDAKLRTRAFGAESPSGLNWMPVR